MGNTVLVSAPQGHSLSVYVAQPQGTPKGRVIVLQEIFGVTGHIRRVTDGFAAAGYTAAAPALFDRVAPGTELRYDEIARGKQIQSAISFEQALEDVESTRTFLGGEHVSVVGYCWGGTLAYLAACRLPIACAVAYYGGFIAKVGKGAPKVPTLYHFGELDPFIPPQDVQTVRELDPQGTVHVYAGSGHGFNCDERADYHPENARIAFERTLEHLARHGGAAAAGN